MLRRKENVFMQQHIDNKVKEIGIPFVPPQVKLDDLKSNGALLLENEIEAVIKILNGKPDKKYGKKELRTLLGPGYENFKFAVVKDGEQYHAVYKDANDKLKKGAAGKGSFGVVKWGQNLKTREWTVLKRIKVSLPEAENEVAMLHKVNQSRGNIVKQNERYIIIAEAAPGIPLYDVIKDNKPFSSAAWLNMVANICQEVSTLHDNFNVLHRDIKPGNFILDPATGKIKAIDFGTTCPKPPNDKIHPKDAKGKDVHIGTIAYMAKEAANENPVSSSKTDVYSLGVTIGEMLGFIDAPNKHSRNLTKTANTKRSEEVIKDANVRKMAYEYVKKMLSENPAERPSAADAAQFFSEMQKKYLSIHDRVISVGILNVDEYLKASAESKANIISALKAFDKIQLVDTQESRPDLQYIALRQEFAERGLMVTNRVFANKSLESAIISVPGRIEKVDRSTINGYRFVTSEDRTPDISNNMKILIANKVDDNHYKIELGKESPGDKYCNSIIESLINEKQRLMGKHTKFKGDFITNSDVKNRIKALDNSIETLRNKRDKKELTYAFTQQNLIQLGSEMKPIGLFAKALNLFTPRDSTGAKNIRALREEENHEIKKREPSVPRSPKKT